MYISIYIYNLLSVPGVHIRGVSVSLTQHFLYLSNVVVSKSHTAPGTEWRPIGGLYWMPYLYRSFSAKEPLTIGLFGKVMQLPFQLTYTYLLQSDRSFSAKEPQITGLFCGKWPVWIRHPMGLCHPAWISKVWMWYSCDIHVVFMWY